MDDVAVWDAALDAAQVSALFNGSSPLLLSGYQPQLGRDLQAGMFNQNSSAYVRMPFMVADPDAIIATYLPLVTDVGAVELNRLTPCVVQHRNADCRRPRGTG